MCPQLRVQMLQLEIPQAKTKTEGLCATAKTQRGQNKQMVFKKRFGWARRNLSVGSIGSRAVMSDSDPAWCPGHKRAQQVHACVSSALSEVNATAFSTRPASKPARARKDFHRQNVFSVTSGVFP